MSGDFLQAFDQDGYQRNLKEALGHFEPNEFFDNFFKGLLDIIKTHRKEAINPQDTAAALCDYLINNIPWFKDLSQKDARAAAERFFTLLAVDPFNLCFELSEISKQRDLQAQRECAYYFDVVRALVSFGNSNLPAVYPEILAYPGKYAAEHDIGLNPGNPYEAEYRKVELEYSCLENPTPRQTAMYLQVMNMYLQQERILRNTDPEKEYDLFLTLENFKSELKTPEQLANEQKLFGNPLLKHLLVDSKYGLAEIKDTLQSTFDSQNATDDPELAKKVAEIVGVFNNFVRELYSYQTFWLNDPTAANLVAKEQNIIAGIHSLRDSIPFIIEHMDSYSDANSLNQAVASIHTALGEDFDYAIEQLDRQRGRSKSSPSV